MVLRRMAFRDEAGRVWRAEVRFASIHEQGSGGYGDVRLTFTNIDTRETFSCPAEGPGPWSQDELLETLASARDPAAR